MCEVGTKCRLEEQSTHEPDPTSPTLSKPEFKQTDTCWAIYADTVKQSSTCGLQGGEWAGAGRVPRDKLSRLEVFGPWHHTSMLAPSGLLSAPAPP